MGTENTTEVSTLGTVIAFLVPTIVLLVTWVVAAGFAMLAANGVMRNVDELTTCYVGGSLFILVLAVVGCGGTARALAKAGKMPLWMGIVLTTSLAIVVESVGACVVFMAAGSVLGIW